MSNLFHPAKQDIQASPPFPRESLRSLPTPVKTPEPLVLEYVRQLVPGASTLKSLHFKRPLQFLLSPVLGGIRLPRLPLQQIHGVVEPALMALIVIQRECRVESGSLIPGLGKCISTEEHTLRIISFSPPPHYSLRYLSPSPIVYPYLVSVLLSTFSFLSILACLPLAVDLTISHRVQKTCFSSHRF